MWWCLGFRPKRSILFFSWSESPLGAPWGLSCAFCWGVASFWPLYHIGRGAHNFLSELLKWVPDDNVWYSGLPTQSSVFSPSVSGTTTTTTTTGCRVGGGVVNSLDLITWFVLWYALSTVGPHIDRCVPFQVMSNQLNWLQVDSSQVIETSQGWSVEKGYAWAQLSVS